MDNQNDNSNSDSLFTNYRYPKPIGNRIYLNKTDVALTIYIYPLQNFIRQLNQQNERVMSGCLVFSFILFIPLLIFMNFLMLFLVASIIYLTIFKLVIVILIFLIPLYFPLRFTLETNYLLISQFSKVYLSINERSFILNWNFLGIKYSVIGRTQDLRSVQIVEFKTLKKIGYQANLCLNQGIYSHKFGLGLFKNEQKWLAQEINDFLETWRSKH